MNLDEFKLKCEICKTNRGVHKGYKLKLIEKRKKKPNKSYNYKIKY